MKENLKPCVYKQRKRGSARPRTFCRTDRRVALCSEVKCFRHGAEAKASLKRAIVAWRRPETGRPIHGQVEVKVKLHGGPNQTSAEKGGDDLWIAVKYQSSSDIAGSPRNSFRASLSRVCWR